MADDKKIIFSMMGVSKTIPPQRKIIKDIYLSFFYGAKIGVIGLNGSGKSTLLKIIAGLDPNYEGQVIWSKEHSIGYLPQEPQLDETKTVKEVGQEGVQQVMDLLKEYEEVNLKFCEPLSDEEMNDLMVRQGELTELIEHHGGWEIDQKLERAMDALRCPEADQPVKYLSGGERRRVALCRLLLQEPDILLLDEPTNHLDAESVEWLEQHLHQYPGTVICVTHDRYFLDNVAGWILELDRGEGIPWEGNYSSWLEQKANRLALEEKQASKRRKTLERELEWVRMAPKARQAKSKARLKAYDRMMDEDVKEGKIADLPAKVKGYGAEKAAEEAGLDVYTLNDVVAEIVKPGRDIRDSLPKPVLRQDIMDIGDLAPGMELVGTVRNVVDFGAFVDIGVHQDGLVHLSEITDRYIRHPSDVLEVGQTVKVWVKDVDVKKNRIGLTMKNPAAKKKSKAKAL